MTNTYADLGSTDCFYSHTVTKCRDPECNTCYDVHYLNSHFVSVKSQTSSHYHSSISYVVKICVTVEGWL